MSLENALYLVEWEPASGAICRLYHKPSQIELITEPRLADNFRLLLPLPDRQANYLLGKQQRLGTVQRTETGVRLIWPGPLVSEEGESFDLDVELEITPMGEALRFSVQVVNRSPLRLAEVWYPLLGGLTGLGERRETWLYTPRKGAQTNQDILWNTRAPRELGTPVPEYLFPFPEDMQLPWVDLYNPHRNWGVYFACHDPSDSQLIFRAEMQPGVGHLRFPDTWPRPEERDPRFPVGVTFAWIYYLAHNRPAESCQGASVILRFHEGDWHQARAFYDEWRAVHSVRK